ncbi:hypothetical protein [Streptomyces sp. KL116D]|uniref:hypothetical protein n=1 Tax=Streptomyces sp. KL116D TaxID=3045152 RepID=UPI00355916A4
MGTPPAGYVYAWKPALFLVSSDEVLRDDQWFRIKRLTIRRQDVSIKFSDGVKVQVAQDHHAGTRAGPHSGSRRATPA